MKFVASDGVVFLRDLEPSDAAAHLAGEDSELVTWFNEGHSSTKAGVDEWIARTRAAGTESRRRELAVVVEGSLVGTVTVDAAHAELAPGEVSVAYGIYPQHRGRGHATRAVRLAGELAASTFDAKVVVLRIHPDNDASAAVARRLGFTAAGTTPDGFVRHVAPLAALTGVRTAPEVAGPAKAVGEFTTQRQALRPMTSGDIDFIAALNLDPSVMRYITGRASSVDESAAELQGSLGTRWLAIDRTNGEPLGWVGAVPVAGDEFDIGWRYRRAAWGQGFASEAAAALIDQLFVAGARRVFAQSMATNTRSRAVMERVGLRFARTFHLEFDDPLSGSDQGEVEYELFRSDRSAMVRDGDGDG